MSIKLAVLRSGEDIIADIKEIISEENIVAYLLDKPHKVDCHKKFVLVEDIDNAQGEVQITLSPWIILSDDEKIPIKPDWVVTIVEPVSLLKEMYEEKVNGKSENGSISEQRNVDNEN